MNYSDMGWKVIRWKQCEETGKDLFSCEEYTASGELTQSMWLQRKEVKTVMAMLGLRPSQINYRLGRAKRKWKAIAEGRDAEENMRAVYDDVRGHIKRILELHMPRFEAAVVGHNIQSSRTVLTVTGFRVYAHVNSRYAVEISDPTSAHVYQSGTHQLLGTVGVTHNLPQKERP